MNLRNRATGLALAALLTGLLAGCADDDTDPVASDPGTGSSGSPAATDSPTPSDAATSEPDGQAATVAAPVYFVGDSPMGPRLYREFRRVEADNPLEEAAALLVAGDTLDPDYSTLLSGVEIASITQGDQAIVVDLSADSRTADKSMSAKDGALAVQSLVYTLQGVAQTRDPVQVTVGGTPTRLFDQPTDTGVKAAEQLDVLAQVSVTTPESDAVLSGTVTASGAASSFEANVPWEITDASGEVVLSGFATADGFGAELTPWQTEIDLSGLDAGSYTFTARTDDPSDGEGPGAFEDTKAFTIS